jgi:alanine transaminase
MVALLSVENINQNIRHLEYAVRGPLVIRAVQLAKEIEAGEQKPFKNVIRANIGDCHAMNQKPLTFYRQMLACATNPALMETDPTVPADVKQRVNDILNVCGGHSVGAYSEACGIELIRRQCAAYIEERDSVPADWQNVFLTTGASEVVKSMLSFVNHSGKPGLPVGVMIPIPQYPLYSATICELGMHQVSYYLDEDHDWRLEIGELERAYQDNVTKCDIRVIVVINPANPTGAVLSRENICQVIEFAKSHNLMIIADEVYQHNIWAEGAQFHSFKKCMHDMNVNLELVSMMSASKGYMGECGLRGGYGELTNFDSDVRAIFYKLLSARLCSSVLGQIAMSCVVNPPRSGEPSYELFEQERQKILSDLKAKAKLVAETFNSIEGISCNQVAGAMYAFPRIELPEKAIKAAEAAGQKPDFFYLMALLEEAGICVVPGSGFGQRPGTFHFRTTILPQPDTFNDMMDRFKKFHKSFIERYS